jgi:hypothetical protein
MNKQTNENLDGQMDNCQYNTKVQQIYIDKLQLLTKQFCSKLMSQLTGTLQLYHENWQLFKAMHYQH